MHIVIVGCGLGGLSAAIGISKAGHKVTVLEKATELGEVGFGIQIPPNSSRILAEWQILPKVLETAIRPSSFEYHSKAGTSLYSLDMTDQSSPYLQAHRADFHRILVDEARQLGVEIRLSCSVTRMDCRRGIVYLEDKPSVQGDLMLGADGLRSACREALLGRPDPPRYTGDMAYRIIFSASKLETHPDIKEFWSQMAIHFWIGPQCHAVAYRLQSGNLYNLVLMAPDTLPSGINSMAVNTADVIARFGGWDPILKTMIGLCDDIAAWRLSDSIELSTWSRGKLALLGDSAHATLPYLGQGAALAVEDGFILGTLFSHVSHPSQIPAILGIYESLRKQRTTTIVQTSKYMQTLYHMDEGPEMDERDRHMREDADKDEDRGRREGTDKGQAHVLPWADPVFQRWLFEYDGFREAEQAWANYERSRFVSGIGMLRASL